MVQFSTHNVFTKSNKAAAWLYKPAVIRLLTMLEKGGEEARVIGGAVRDTILGKGVKDIDIATTVLPDKVIELARANGFTCAPVGLKFGTVTVIVEGKTFQITTLRQDITTDGRHAQVRFCRDWAIDAERRDFTINALSVDKKGRLYDYVGGLADIEASILRFIGDPYERIKEDYLRILRYFRFYALMGPGRPEPQAIKAITMLKDGLLKLSAERVWEELKKLLAIDDPFRSVLWMRMSGVLSLILPESTKWGIDALQGLVSEKDKKDKGDSLLRLMALIPPQIERIKALAARLRFSASEKRRLLDWAAIAPGFVTCSTRQTEKITANMDDAALKKLIYQSSRKTDRQNAKIGAVARQTLQAVLDALKIAAANARIYNREDDYRAYKHLLTTAQNWPVPHFPLNGTDIGNLGLHGNAVGQTLRKLENIWVESDFALSKAALLKKVKPQQIN